MPHLAVSAATHQAHSQIDAHNGLRGLYSFPLQNMGALQPEVPHYTMATAGNTMGLFTRYIYIYI